MLVRHTTPNSRQQNISIVIWSDITPIRYDSLFPSLSICIFITWLPPSFPQQMDIYNLLLPFTNNNIKLSLVEKRRAAQQLSSSAARSWGAEWERKHTCWWHCKQVYLKVSSSFNTNSTCCILYTHSNCVCVCKFDDVTAIKPLGVNVCCWAFDVLWTITLLSIFSAFSTTPHIYRAIDHSRSKQSMKIMINAMINLISTFTNSQFTHYYTIVDISTSGSPLFLLLLLKETNDLYFSITSNHQLPFYYWSLPLIITSNSIFFTNPLTPAIQ